MKDRQPSDSKETKQTRFSLHRRAFLKLSLFTGAAMGADQIAGPPGPNASVSLQKASSKVLEERWILTSCLNCPARCAIQARIVDEKVVKITGNPFSQVSEGKICPRAHVGLQVLYDPGRISTPLKRTNREKGRGVDPKWVAVSWDQALDEVAGRLRKIRENGEPHRVLLLRGLNSTAAEDMISRFAEALGTPNLISGDGLDCETEKSGNWMADGNFAGTAYDLDHTHYILAFGADLLEAFKPLSRFLRKWGRIRRERPNRAKIVAVHPRYSVTAAKADEWIPINPGTDGALAMAIAHVIIRDQLHDKTFVKDWTVGFDSYKERVLSQYSPEEVSKKTGIEPAAIERLATEFAKTRPAVAIRGRESINWPEGSFTSYAIFCLNALVGSIDVPGGIIYQEGVKYNEMPALAKDEVGKKGLAQPTLDLRGTEKFPVARTATHQVPESLLEKRPYPAEMAIGFNSNFNMTSPAPDRWDKALKQLPYYVHISPFISEMAAYADLVLPSTTYLEEWGYDHSPAGAGFAEVRIKQPAVPPRGSARSIVDLLFQLAKRLNGPVAQSFAKMGDHSEGFVRFRTEPLIPWKGFLKVGVWIGKGYEYKKYGRIFQTPSTKFEFSSGNLRSLFAKTRKGREEGSDSLPRHQDPRFLGDPEKYPFVLLPYQPLMVIENGSQNYPWAQEIFLPLNGTGWETPVEINSETAKSMKLKDGQRVWVESPFQKIKAKLKCSEGVHPQVVAIASGQGHDAYGKWQKNVGVNPNEILGVDYDSLTGQAAFFNTRVKVYKA